MGKVQELEKKLAAAEAQIDLLKHLLAERQGLSLIHI